MFIRRLHTVPRLTFDTVPSLFSKKAMDTAWSKHQAHLLAKLSKATVDTDDAVRIPFHILLNAARRRDAAHVFNYASQAHNNHLFFEALAPASTPSSPSPALMRRIERSFGSLENLGKAMETAASTVHGNGWVFLVEAPSKELQVLASNNAGTPYHFARQQSIDLNAAVDEDSVKLLEKTDALVAQNAKNFNVCLLALNLWQHAYIDDFGIDGREKYIRSWFAAVNWSVVSSRLFGEGRA